MLPGVLPLVVARRSPGPARPPGAGRAGSSPRAARRRPWPQGGRGLRPRPGASTSPPAVPGPTRATIPRTPPTGVLGMALFGAERSLASPHREHLVVMRDYGQTLLAILNDVLDMLQDRSRQLRARRQRVRSGRSYVPPSGTFAVLADQKDVVFVIEIEPETPGRLVTATARSAPGDLERLASNAVKFTPRGPVPNRSRRRYPKASTSSWPTPASASPPAADRRSLPEVQARWTPPPPCKFGLARVWASPSRRELVSLMGGRDAHGKPPGEGSTFVFPTCPS